MAAIAFKYIEERIGNFSVHQAEMHAIGLPIIGVLGGLVVLGVLFMAASKLRKDEGRLGSASNFAMAFGFFQALFAMTVCFSTNFNFAFFYLCAGAAAFAVGIAMTTETAIFAGILNTLGVYMGTASMTGIVGLVPLFSINDQTVTVSRLYMPTLMDTFGKDSCDEYYRGATNDGDIIDNRCDDEEFLNFMRAMALLLLVTAMMCALACFIIASLRSTKVIPRLNPFAMYQINTGNWITVRADKAGDLQQV